TTDASDLFDTFLDALPPELRPIYVCSACRTFMRRFGGVVRVTPTGETVSVMWDPEAVAEPYVAAVRALASAVARAPIVDVFLATEPVWGQPVTGEWHHFAVTPPAALIFKPSAIQTTGQRVAEKREDYAILLRGLTEFPADLVINAHTLLTTGSLYRSEKCIGVARWLMDLHEQRRGALDERRRTNLTWVAVASAPAGFCHVRSSMIGTLLEDLAAELPFEEIKAKFAAKMHPLQYQRPTAAPSAGNIAQAEKIIEQLRTAGALERRFARLADIVAVWKPRPVETPQGKGVFSHLKPKQAQARKAVVPPPVTMTWDKFSRTVLPDAESIEYHVPAGKESYLGMVTAKHADAPPIVQWDSESQRNPVTWYVYHGGSAPADWNLKAGVRHPVTAVTLAPWMWHATDKNRSSHQGQSVVFILDGARDMKYSKGAAFFPEFLRSEYHSIRSTMEAYAKSAVVEGKDEAEACGLVLTKGGNWNHVFRVTSKNGVQVDYKIDRWD
ncbi:MAG TPA: hypothetical protein VGB85_17235, partial [Nannocystis sp.]